MPYRRETREKERDTRSLNRLVSLSNQSKRLVFAILVSLFLFFPSSAIAKMDRSDSSYVSTLNMTEEQKEMVYGVDSSTLAKGPTLQELNEENPTYVKRDYDHRQQVVVGSVVMFCVALAMVLMNNYNPKR